MITQGSDTVTLPASLQQLIDRLERATTPKPSEIGQFLKAAAIDPEDLAPWSDLEHPATDSYGRRLIYQSDRYEIMVMSWQPGDFSAIHDHGGTEWGAVQIFGPAEHATFRLEADQLTTLKRWVVAPGAIVGVSNALIHQMGNPTADQPFISLHVYGQNQASANITGNARLMEPIEGVIQRVNGGVFFALPESEIANREPGLQADFPTKLRHTVEYIRRLRQMEASEEASTTAKLEHAIRVLEAPDQRAALINYLQPMLDSSLHTTDSAAWRVLCHELRVAGQLQEQLRSLETADDPFANYAALYDHLVGKPCYDEFIGGYLQMAADQFDIPFSTAKILSIGCGTGLVEAQMIEQFGLNRENVYGIDLSGAMVREARKHIRADEGNILDLDPEVRKWELIFSSLNVYHYLPAEKLEEGIQRTAAILEEGGWFVADFICPDHIRWYPNVLTAPDEQIISVRTPQLVERDGLMYQESEIINVDFTTERMQVFYAGKHYRFLPPMNRVRQYFQSYFKEVQLFDAVHLSPIPASSDSCRSTRYLVVARR